ncbi:MAG TPA: dihydroorotate dehydrogenase-like protein [Planctomycetota bacterium]|nr:dihydroorotate dehydrogenase-like protein [Planctomycetota bacterium]
MPNPNSIPRRYAARPAPPAPANPLRTKYLGLDLDSPLVVGACPLCDDIDAVRLLEEYGASAIVMHSLFEEQITGEQLASIYMMESVADSYSEARSYFPRADEYGLGPSQYLEQIQRIKRAVKIPCIASLNGTTVGGWTNYARMIEQAGADAIELNVYHIPTDPTETGAEVEMNLLEIVRYVRNAVKIPVAVKLSPFFSSIANLAGKLEQAGANGVVLFNRFYQPDVNIVDQTALPNLQLSEPGETLLLRLRWLAIISNRFNLSLACSGGVHSAEDVIKAVMCGAHAVQLVSVLLKNGPAELKFIRTELAKALKALDYRSIEQIQGSMSLIHCPDPRAFERANYMRILQSWKPDLVWTANPALQKSPR